MPQKKNAVKGLIASELMAMVFCTNRQLGRVGHVCAQGRQDEGIEYDIRSTKYPDGMYSKISA